MKITRKLFHNNTVSSIQYPVGSQQCSVDSTTDYCQLPTGSCLLETADCQLPTADWKLATADSEQIPQHKFKLVLLILLLGLSCGCTDSQGSDPVFSMTEAGPEVRIDNAAITLLVKEPDIATPTGVQVDDENRIWVIENHTHVRQDDYPGPKVDRILVFSGYIDSSEKKQVTEFATDFIDGMSLSFTEEGKVLVTTRASILEFADTDGDLVADERRTLISLKTEEKFPHNGMSGLAVSPDGRLYFQCGENFGAYYEISGTDGTMLIGKEREGGSLYRCRADGSELERIGTAVWNCFAMTFDDFGNLFAVENDPDSRPPCRLLHIVKGGNYGFQFQHGRDGLSPLTSWFGQLPGTLPMVAGTGEAPSGVFYYNQDKFGPENQGTLLVTAWGDNEIQRFKLETKGSSFTAEPRSFVKGARDFYPVGLAVDDRGGVIATDWASVSYAVHGQGRIWRIANPEQDRVNPKVGGVKSPSKTDLIGFLNASDSRIRAEAANRVLSIFDAELHAFFKEETLSDKGKMNLLWATQSGNHSALRSLLDLSITEENELLRSAAVRMTIDEKTHPDEKFYLNLIQNDPSDFVIREAVYGLKTEQAFSVVAELFRKDDPFLHTAVIETFGKAENLPMLKDYARDSDPKIRLGALLCLRRSGTEEAKSVIPAFLDDPVTENRITALKWVAEDRLIAFRDNVERSFASVPEISSELFDAYVVTFQYLDGAFNQKNHFMEGDEHVSQTFYKRQKFLLATAKNEKLSNRIRARALAGINPNHENLDLETLEQLSKEADVELQIEAIRSISARNEDMAAIGILREVATDNRRKEQVRLEALVGLSGYIQNDPRNKAVFLDIVKNKRESNAVRRETMRGLTQLPDDAEVKPWIEDYNRLLPDKEDAATSAFWRNLAEEQGNALAGARIFHSARYQCNTCHRINGRGGIFGPDLSKVGGNANRDRIVESILDPSDIVTPTYAGYAVKSKGGEVVVGRLDKDLDSKRHLQLIQVDGKRARVAYDDIVEQNMLEQSLMPVNLHRQMTAKEFRDLIQYLLEQQ